RMLTRLGPEAAMPLGDAERADAVRLRDVCRDQRLPILMRGHDRDDPDRAGERGGRDEGVRDFLSDRATTRVSVHGPPSARDMPAPSEDARPRGPMPPCLVHRVSPETPGVGGALRRDL